MNQDLVDLIESNLEHVEKFHKKFDHVQDSQNPKFVTVCCSDSRVLQDHMWENETPGNIFTCSNIGNRVYQSTENGFNVSGDILYPVEHTDTDTVVVIGHTGCGAVTATYKDLKSGLDEPDGIRHCIELLKYQLREGFDELNEDIAEDKAVNRLVEFNVDRQVDFLISSDEIPEDVDVIGVVYDFQNVYSGSRGQVYIVNINGEKSVKNIKKKYPEIKESIERIWEY